MKLAALASVLLVAAACSAITVTPRPLPTAARPQVLELENRGGPPFTVNIGETDVLTVGCNDTGRITPGEASAPPLPWDLTLIRVRDGSIIFATQVDELPRYFLQIGEEALQGLSTSPAQGPPGPTCPPGE